MLIRDKLLKRYYVTFFVWPKAISLKSVVEILNNFTVLPLHHCLHINISKSKFTEKIDPKYGGWIYPYAKIKKKKRKRKRKRNVTWCKMTLPSWPQVTRTYPLTVSIGKMSRIDPHWGLWRWNVLRKRVNFQAIKKTNN